MPHQPTATSSRPLLRVRPHPNQKGPIHTCPSIRTGLRRVVASQMATYLGKALNKTSAGSELVAQPGFKWKNKGSMVFIGDQSVRSP